MRVVKGKNEENDFTDKVNVLGKIAAMITKYGIVKIVSALMIFILFIGISIIFINQKTIVAKILTEQKQAIQTTNAKNLQFRVQEVNPRVEAILYKLIAETKCDRVYVIEMHNGTDNPSGMPFAYGDMTYERTFNDSLISVMPETKNLTLSAYPISTYLLKYKFFYGNSDDVRKIDKKLANRLDENDVKYIMLYCVRGNDVELGCVGVSYLSGPPANLKLVQASLLDASQRLSILLDINNNILTN